VSTEMLSAKRPWLFLLWVLTQAVALIEVDSGSNL
jgi:hypothetical protein